MSKQVFYGSLICLGFFWIVPAAAATADHAVMSQVQITGGPGKTTEDFVELYNPTGQDIDLQGMRLVKRTQTGTADTLLKSWTTSAIIKAHGYYLWANSGFTGISMVPDATTTGSLANDNGVALRNGPNDSGTVVDSVAWGAAANAFIEGAVSSTNPDINQSLERKPGGGQGNGEDTDDNSRDFFLQTTAHPRSSQSPVEPISQPPGNSPLPPPSNGGPAGGGVQEAFQVDFSEIMPNPKGKDSGFEWVELYNAGANPVDLSSWFLDDQEVEDRLSNNAFVIPSGTIIGPQSFLVITIPKGKFALNNTGGDAIRLLDNFKVAKLKQTYSDPAKDGFSYAKDSSGSWLWSPNPTPGSANSFEVAGSYPSSIRISEALPDPAGDDSEGEFIELQNFGSDSVDLADWVVADSRKRYVVNADDLDDTELAPNGYLVLYREVTNISLNNTGSEELSLFNPAGELVQKLIYDGQDRKGESYVWKTDTLYEWTAAATPGRANEFRFAVGQENQKSARQSATPVPELVSLKDLRNKPSGSLVRTSGVVVVEPGVLGKQVTYLAGSGIRIWLEDVPETSLQPGDEVQVTGLLASYHNELQLKVSSAEDVKIIGNGIPVNPHDIATGQVGEETEGFLVRIHGKVTKTAGDTFYLNDGTGEAKIYIKSGSEVEKPPLKTGQEIKVVGVVSQYDESYRVLPRYQSDLVLPGGVKGVSRSSGLPRTGSNFWLILALFLACCYVVLVGFPLKKPKICL